MERPRHSAEACAKLLGGLSMPDGREPDVVEILGRALWDVFSDNHTVVDSEGTAYDLGSFRGSAEFIAQVLNERYPWLERRYTYLDFYMGGALVGGRVDLGPVYRRVFSHLRAAGCNWIYSFPRLHVLDLRGSVPPRDDELAYDPSEAVRAELEERERREEFEALSARLDEAYQDAVRQARHEPLPCTVTAYRDVFGVLPEGWPHPDM